MTRTSLARAVTLLLLAAGLVAPAGASAATPVLAGTTTLTGTRTARIVVRVPRPATLRNPLFSTAARNDVVTSGGSGFTGFVLRRKDGRFLVVGGRLVGPVADRTFAQEYASASAGDKTVIPAGEYELYLLTGGGRTTVTFRLGGLSGSTRLAPTSARAFTVASPAPQLAPSAPAAVAYSAGGSARVRGNAVTFGFLYHQFEAHAETDYWRCLFDGAPGNPAPYTPGCLGLGADSTAVHVLYSDEGVGRGVGYLMGVEQHFGGAGVIGQGVWMATAVPATRIGYTHFWLSL